MRIARSSFLLALSGVIVSALVGAGTARSVVPVRVPIQGTGWGNPIEVDPPLGPPTALSCPRASACVLVDGRGAVVTGSGRDWSPPTFIDRGHSIVALSCPTLSYCAAFDADGRSLTYDGSGWSKPLHVGGADGVVDVSCGSATYCLAVTSTSHVLSFDGDGWADEGRIPGTTATYASVGCAIRLCAVGDQEGRVVTWNGAKWSPWHVLQPSRAQPTDVACPSSTGCFAVSGSAASRLHDGKWHDAGFSQGSLHALSCASPTFCMALSKFKVALVYRDGSWSLPETRERGRDAAALACATESNCLFVSHWGEGWTWDGTRWGMDTQVERQAKPFSTLSCPSDGFCALTDNYGSLMMLQGDTWSAPSSLDDVTWLPKVSCISSSRCFLMDYFGHPLYTWNGHQWTRSDSFLLSWGGFLSCTTSRSCIGVSENFTAYYRHGWIKVDPPLFDEFPTAATCATSKFCMGAYENGVVYPFNGRSWGSGSVVADGQRIAAIACSTPDLCFAVLTDGTVARYDGSTWGAPMAVIPSGVVSVSCPTPSFCAVVSATGEEAEFDGTSWSDPVVVDPKGDDVLISCSSVAFCVAADSKGFVVAKGSA